MQRLAAAATPAHGIEEDPHHSSVADAIHHHQEEADHGGGGHDLHGGIFNSAVHGHSGRVSQKHVQRMRRLGGG